MTVRSYGTGEDRRIAVGLGHGEHGLIIAEATELRDALTRELGAPQALTDREAMVWAAEFVREMAHGSNARVAACSARNAVQDLRSAPTAHRIAGWGDDDETDAMLVAMIGGGR